MKETTTIKVLLGIGILASILVGIGEYLLHFSPDGPAGEVSMLENVPLERAAMGHFFSVFSTPLYFAGYFGLRNFFQKSNKTLANALLVLGILAFSIGGVWISSRYMGAVVLQTSAGSSDYAFYLQTYEAHYQILVWALRIIIALLSIVYVLLILKNTQGVAKWLAIFNPVFILILVISSLFWLPPLGVHIAPIAMNVTHFIFFGLLLWQVNKTVQQ